MVSRNQFAFQFRRILSFLLCLALAITLVPLGSHSNAFAEAGDSGTSDEEIQRLLSLNDYVDGEAIVIIDESVQSPQFRLFSTDLLSSAEPIMKTTEEVYETAVNGLHDETNVPEVFTRSISPLDDSKKETVSVLHLTNTGHSTEELLYLLSTDPRVLHAEPNYLYEAEPQTSKSLNIQKILPSNDTLDLTDYQWANSNTKEVMHAKTKALDFDINTPQWENRTDSSVENASGTVAVVDTGIDYDHPDLVNVIRNDMDSIVGYGGKHGFNADTTSSDPEPTDLNGHGTHCAGIIASEWNNFGTSGVASGVKMIGVRICDENSMIASSYTLQAYEYLADALDKGVDLKAINNSWGGKNTDRAFSLAVAKVGEKGAISVIASGNDYANIDHTANSSAVMQSNPYAVIINASTMHGAKADFSNYGIATTNLFAPGTQILSTFPTSMSQYLPEAVAAASTYENIVYESFSSSFLADHAFKAYGGEALDTPIGVRETDAYFDSISELSTAGALKIEAKDMKKDTSSNGRKSRVFEASLTVPQSEQESVRYLGFHFFVPQTPGRFLLETSLLVKDKDENPTWRSMARNHWLSEWRNASYDVQDFLHEGDTLYFGDNSNDQMKLKFEYCYLEAEESMPSDSDIFYLDSVGIGRDGATVPFMYLEGTSMATPVATGAAMVLAKTDDTSLSRSEQAKERAAKLSGSARPWSAFKDLCTSGGALDLAMAEAGRYTPVPSTVEFVNEQSKTQLTIKGWFFGETQGTVTVGGVAAPVTNWSDNAITIQCPSGLSAGVHNISVTSVLKNPDETRTGNKSFLLDLPESPEKPSTPLYEVEYSLPDEFKVTGETLMTEMIGLGGYLYLLTGGLEEEGLFSEMWKLDPSVKSWEKCTSLPELLDYISAVTYDGKIIVSGVKTVGDEKVQILYSYDPFTDTWTALPKPIDDLPVLSTLANWNESLLILGGAEKYISDKIENYSNAINKYDPKSGELNQIGSLTMRCILPNVAVHSDSIFVIGGTLGSKIILADHLAMPNCTTTDVSALMPSFSAERENPFALTALAKGFALIGPSALDHDAKLEDQDTYLLESADASTETSTLDLGSGFKPFDKRVSHAQLFYPSATAYREKLYALGLSYYEENGIVLRATAVETLDQPGDLYSIRYHGASEQEHNNPTSYTAMRLPYLLADASGRKNETFVGWYDNANLSGNPITSITEGTTGNIELWAKWESANPHPDPSPNDSDDGSKAIAATGDSHVIEVLFLFAVLALLSLGALRLAFRRMNKQ